jgi:hypothetical protein
VVSVSTSSRTTVGFWLISRITPMNAERTQGRDRNADQLRALHRASSVASPKSLASRSLWATIVNERIMDAPRRTAA